MATLQGELARYEDLVAHRDNLESAKQQLIDAAIPAEVKAEIDAIEAEIEPEIESLDAEINALAADLKNAVVATGQKIIGTRFQVIYTKPRAKWNTKALDGYAAAHPEILAFRSEGKPGAQIRVMK